MIMVRIEGKTCQHLVQQLFLSVRSTRHGSSTKEELASDRRHFDTVDSVGLGDIRGCDECKELLESEQWLAL
jgi:hypothetical protein